MTLTEQQRWLEAERKRNECLLAETMVLGETILAKARADLAAIGALLATLKARQMALPLGGEN